MDEVLGRSAVRCGFTCPLFSLVRHVRHVGKRSVITTVRVTIDRVKKIFGRKTKYK